MELEKRNSESLVSTCSGCKAVNIQLSNSEVLFFSSSLGYKGCLMVHLNGSYIKPLFNYCIYSILLCVLMDFPLCFFRTFSQKKAAIEREYAQVSPRINLPLLSKQLFSVCRET